ncbi:unnamed protein product [Caretta caretta]
MVGTLALPEGPELLDRKQCSKQVLNSPNSDLPPSHWLLPPVLSMLRPPGCPSQTLARHRPALSSPFPEPNRKLFMASKIHTCKKRARVVEAEGSELGPIYNLARNALLKRSRVGDHISRWKFVI